MKRKTLLLFITISLAITPAWAQQTRQERLDSLDKLRLERMYGVSNRQRRLDTIYNDPFFYPTVSAVLLPKGFIEINNAAALLTATRLFTDQARPDNLNARTTTFSHLLQLTYGVSAGSRLNIGVDVFYNAFRLDLDPGASPWRVFKADSALSRDAGVNTVGMRFRLKPQVRNRHFVVQGGLYLPVRRVADNPASARVQAIYVFDLAKTLFLYAQGTVVYSFPKQSLAAVVSLPVAAVVQYQIRPSLGILGVVGNNLTFIIPKNGATGQTAFGTQVGGGLQYQPSLRFGVTGFYTRYILGRNSPAYHTGNLAVRVII